MSDHQEQEASGCEKSLVVWSDPLARYREGAVDLVKEEGKVKEEVPVVHRDAREVQSIWTSLQALFARHDARTDTVITSCSQNGTLPSLNPPRLIPLPVADDIRQLSPIAPSQGALPPDPAHPSNSAFNAGCFPDTSCTNRVELQPIQSESESSSHIGATQLECIERVDSAHCFAPPSSPCSQGAKVDDGDGPLLAHSAPADTEVNTEDRQNAPEEKGAIRDPLLQNNPTALQDVPTGVADAAEVCGRESGIEGQTSSEKEVQPTSAQMAQGKEIGDRSEAEELGKDVSQGKREAGGAAHISSTTVESTIAAPAPISSDAPPIPSSASLSAKIAPATASSLAHMSAIEEAPPGAPSDPIPAIMQPEASNEHGGHVRCDDKNTISPLMLRSSADAAPTNEHAIATAESTSILTATKEGVDSNDADRHNQTSQDGNELPAKATTGKELTSIDLAGNIMNEGHDDDKAVALAEDSQAENQSTRLPPKYGNGHLSPHSDIAHTPMTDHAPATDSAIATSTHGGEFCDVDHGQGLASILAQKDADVVYLVTPALGSAVLDHLGKLDRPLSNANHDFDMQANDLRSTQQLAVESVKAHVTQMTSPPAPDTTHSNDAEEARPQKRKATDDNDQDNDAVAVKSEEIVGRSKRLRPHEEVPFTRIDHSSSLTLRPTDDSSHVREQASDAALIGNHVNSLPTRDIPASKSAFTSPEHLESCNQLEVMVASSVELPSSPPSNPSGSSRDSEYIMDEAGSDDSKGQWRVGRLPGHQGSHIRRKENHAGGSPGHKRSAAHVSSDLLGQFVYLSTDGQIGEQDTDKVLKKPFRLPAKVSLAPAKSRIAHKTVASLPTVAAPLNDLVLQQTSENVATRTPQGTSHPPIIPPRPSKPTKQFAVPHKKSPESTPSPTFSNMQPAMARKKKSFVSVARVPTSTLKQTLPQISQQVPGDNDEAAVSSSPPSSSTTSSSPIATSRASRPFKLPFTRSTAPSPATPITVSVSAPSRGPRAMSLRERIIGLEQQERTLKQAIRYLNTPEEDERLAELVKVWKGAGRQVAELLFDVTPKPDAQATGQLNRGGWQQYDTGRGGLGGHEDLTDEQLEYLAHAPTNEDGEPLDMEGNPIFAQPDMDLGSMMSSSGTKTRSRGDISTYDTSYASLQPAKTAADLWDIGTMLEKIGVDDPTLFAWDADNEDWQAEDTDDNLD